MFGFQINKLKLNALESTFGYDNEDNAPILKGVQADQVKQIEQIKPSYVCILSNDGTLLIVNSKSIETACKQSADTMFDLSLDMINQRLLYENDVIKFPGHVH